uniref:Uncharacterized protein n=1 Tax=Anthurium amnicola TaxID=1678845 RepID=A0A1D1XY54_9ARAE
MEAKRLDLNAPLLSVRRFASARPPSPSSADAAAAAAVSRAENGGRTVVGQGPRRSSFPFYKSDLKSGPVVNAGVIPFFWERSPGQPKEDGSGSGGAAAKPAGRPLVAPKPPPGRIPSRLPNEKEQPISRDAMDLANNGVLLRGTPPISSTSTSTTPTTPTATSGSATSLKTKPVVEEKAPILEEQPSGSEGGDEEEGAFSDALDTLSHAESCLMSCSVSGLGEPSGRFSTDPQARDFMMGRFLPAAQAMAAGSPQYASRKPSVPSRGAERPAVGSVGERRRAAVPLPYQHRPHYALGYQTKVGNSDVGDDDDHEDDEYDEAGHLSLKGCGFLPRFCTKSSFCLLNPVPGLKVRGLMPMPAARGLSPQVRALRHGSVGHGEDEHTWEEVYKHKLGRVNRKRGEEASKLTSESYQLSYWSDSQTADGSSSCRRSTIGGGVSPCRNDISHSPLHEGKVFVGVPNIETRSREGADVFETCGKDGEQYWEIMPHLSSKQTSGSLSPEVEKTVYVDSVQPQVNPGSKLNLSDAKTARNCVGKDFEISGDSPKIDESLMLEVCDYNVSQHKISEVVDAHNLCAAKVSGALESMDKAEDHVLDCPRHLEAEDRKNNINALQALLPPPFPKSPSESWLQRTLPSVASKNSTPMSFLGIQLCPKRQVIQASSTHPRWETKKRGPPKGQTRFADVLGKPANED